MRKILLAFSLLLVFSFRLNAQEIKLPKIALNINSITFGEFAGILNKKYGILIYYQPEWVKDIRVTLNGDSVDIGQIFDKLLKPDKINYWFRANNQCFITGDRKLMNTPQRNNYHTTIPRRDSNGQSISKTYFGNYSYEKKIRKVVVGSLSNTNRSEKCYLSGRITNSANGEPVIGATVLVSGTNNGIISDGNGDYVLPVPSGTTFKLNVSSMEMNPGFYLVEMRSSGMLNIEMDPKLINIQEIVVKSDIHNNVRGLQMGFQRIDAQEIKSIPVVMGERDILKVASLTPGVQTVGEGSAGFNVRGSSSDQNLFLLNDIPVLNTGHLFGFFSAFNPDIINGFNLYKSNFPAEYGGRLASIFELFTRKGNKKKFGARGSVSPVTGSLLIESPVVKDKSSVILSVRSTYSDWILNRLNNADLYKRKGSFYDVMAGFHHLGNHNDSWQIFEYYSKDKFALSTTHDYHYENIGASVIYDRKIRDKWSMNFAGVFSNYSNYQGNREQETRAFEHKFRVRSEELKIKFTGYPAARHKTGFGADIILHHLDQGIIQPTGDHSILTPIDLGREAGLEYALFASDEITITDRLTLYAGLRYSFFNYLGPNDINVFKKDSPYVIENIIDTISYTAGKTIARYSGPEYRVALNWELNPDFSLKLSYNRMRQYIYMLSNTTSISPTDRWKLTDPFTVPPVSDQVSFGIYKNLNQSTIETSAEIYYKKTNHIIDYKDGADLSFNPAIETLTLQGMQKAWGAEFLIRKKSGRFTGWISYTYSRSLITVNGEKPWEKINYGLTYPASYDKPHALNLVGNLKISRRLSVSTNLVYSTGRPITYPTGYFIVDGYKVVNYSLRNEFRIPDYFRWDLSLNLEGNLLKKKFAHGSWMLSVYNVTGRRNAYSIYFTNDEGYIRGYKLSIYGVPIFTITYNFKLGNYAVN